MAASKSVDALALVPSNYLMDARTVLGWMLVSKRIYRETDCQGWLLCLKRKYDSQQLRLHVRQYEVEKPRVFGRLRSWSSIDTETSGKS